MKFKKTYYAEMCWSSEYWVSGINILDNKNRKLIKEVNIDIDHNVDYTNIFVI